MAQLKIPAVFMRGGTSKGVFFHRNALPANPLERDALLLRIVGSPDPYGKQIDGMGGASSSTSKVVIISKSSRAGCDVDYLFGAVPINSPVIDWSGNCGNLASAVGPFAITEGLVAAPPDGSAVVRIWQVNTARRIVAHVPMRAGAVVETGEFQLDGVAFRGAEIKLEFLDPGRGEDGGGMFPTGRLIDVLEIPQLGRLEATLIHAGNPMIFIEARALHLRGDERPCAVNSNRELLARCETIRAEGAVAMGLADTTAEATAKRPATPKLAFVAPPSAYVCSSGKEISSSDLDLNVRILSMGQLHHAMTGTGAIAVAIAAKIPGTIVHRALRGAGGAGEIRVGHPSGTLTAAAEVELRDGRWIVTKAVMSRSARRLMEGSVLAPASPPGATA